MIDELADRYPRSIEVDGQAYELRRMTAQDEASVLHFAQGLPQHDLLFLRRDITQPKVMSAWARDVAAGHIVSLIALKEQAVIGCSAVVTDPYSFSPHVGELRVVLSPEQRAHGIGRVLVQESFLVALALELEKLTVQMTADQSAAIAVFEDLGFHAEAHFRNHVRDRDGVTYDLVVLSHNVAAVEARMEAYGLPESLG